MEKNKKTDVDNKIEDLLFSLGVEVEEEEEEEKVDHSSSDFDDFDDF